VKEKLVELDDLKQAVAELDRGIAEVRDLSIATYKERRLDRTRASLRPVVWEHAGQVALGIVLTVVGQLWWSERGEPALLVAGLVLHLYAVLMIALGLRVIVSIRALDLDAPVVEIQRALARLRRSYVMTGFIVGMPWWLLWIPFVMFVFGIDLNGRFSWNWLITNLIIGVVGIVGTLWYFRRLWIEPVDSERRRGIEASFSGKSFRSAQRFLEEIARFERE
jgi:serine/threonine-protein kinase